MAGKESERTPTPVDNKVIEPASILMSLTAKPQTESDTSSSVTPPVTPIPTVPETEVENNSPEKEVEKKKGSSVSRTKFDLKTNFRGRDRNNKKSLPTRTQGILGLSSGLVNSLPAGVHDFGYLAG